MADRDTLSRLERAATQDRQVALEAVRQSYDALSTAVLSAARGRGYLGADVTGAAEVLAGPDPDLARLGAAAADLWLAFFACFHPHLAPLDSGHFQGGIDALNQRLRALRPGTPPDPALAADLLVILEGLWTERHDRVARQLDRLVAQAGGGGGGLEAVIDTALAEAGLVPSQQETPGERLARVLAHWRRAAEQARQDTRETTAAVGTFLRAVKAVAAGQSAPALPGEAGVILGSVRALDAARREQEKDLRALRAQVQSLEAQRQEALAELAERQRQAVAPPEGDPDARLGFYRAALAAWESGGDPGTHLAKARELERVITLGSDGALRLSKLLDRCHADLVRRLQELFDLSPLIDDPRRYRPRGILGLGAKPVHDLKSVPGLVEALRDGGRDLAVYADRAQWAVGLDALASEAPKIRAVFKELVKLVAHWREKLGDPPPVSVSMSLDGGSGIVALPAVVATDIEAMTRKKAKVGPASLVLAPLLEDCVALYHHALGKAGATVPPRTTAKPRESPIQALIRLSAELDQLAGICEANFASAARDDFRPSSADSALLADDHLLRAGLQAVDDAASEVARCTGAPALAVLDPVKRGDPASLAAAVAGRITWLEQVARYRIVVG